VISARPTLRVRVAARLGSFLGALRVFHRLRWLTGTVNALDVCPFCGKVVAKDHRRIRRVKFPDGVRHVCGKCWTANKHAFVKS